MSEVRPEPVPPPLQKPVHVAELLERVANLVCPALPWQAVDLA